MTTERRVSSWGNAVSHVMNACCLLTVLLILLLHQQHDHWCHWLQDGERQKLSFTFLRTFGHRQQTCRTMHPVPVLLLLSCLRPSSAVYKHKEMRTYSALDQPPRFLDLLVNYDAAFERKVAGSGASATDFVKQRLVNVSVLLNTATRVEGRFGNSYVGFMPFHLVIRDIVRADWEPGNNMDSAFETFKLKRLVGKRPEQPSS